MRKSRIMQGNRANEQRGMSGPNKNYEQRDLGTGSRWSRQAHEPDQEIIAAGDALEASLRGLWARGRDELAALADPCPDASV